MMTGTMGTMPCKVSDCKRLACGNIWAATRSSSWCHHHRQRARRHGDPLQPSIQTKTVRVVAREIERIVQRDASGKLEAVCHTLYQNLRGYVESVVQDRERYEAAQGRRADGHRVGRTPFPGWTAFAARELLRALSAVTPVTAAANAGALFLMRHREPRRFVSEDGWHGAFVRTWRKCCGPIAFGYCWNHKRQRMEAHYRELPVRCVKQMALLLVTTYAPFASRLFALEQKREALPRVVRQYLDDAFAVIDGTLVKRWKNRAKLNAARRRWRKRRIERDPEWRDRQSAYLREWRRRKAAEKKAAAATVSPAVPPQPQE